MNPVESWEFERNGRTYIVEIFPDDEPSNPREWDNLGVMYCEHRRYNLGDSPKTHPDYEAVAEAISRWQERSGSWEMLIRYLRIAVGAKVVLPLYLLDHSGLAMSTSSFMEDPQGWDSGVVGIICDTAASRERLGVAEKDVEPTLRDEVGDYSAYLRGDCYYWQVSHTETCDHGYAHKIVDDAMGGYLIRDRATWEQFLRNVKTEAEQAIPRTAYTDDEVLGTLVSEGYDRRDVLCAIDQCIAAGLELEQPREGRLFSVAEYEVIREQLDHHLATKED